MAVITVQRKPLTLAERTYLPQIAEIDRTFPINVYDMVSMGLWRSAGLFGGIGGKQRDRIEHAIEAVLKTNTVEHWLKLLGKAGIPCGPIYSIDQAFFWQ